MIVTSKPSKLARIITPHAHFIYTMWSAAVKKLLKSLGNSFGNLMQAPATGHVPLSCEDGATNIDLLNKQQSVPNACDHMTSSGATIA